MDRRAILLLGLVVSLGCGLSDYEQHIDEERARIKVFDEENKLLGDLVENPSDVVKDKKDVDKTVKAWPFDVFLRLPKGTAIRPDEKEGSYAASDLKLFRFKGTDGYSVMISASKVGTRDKEGNLKEGLPAKEFRDNVFEAVNVFLRSHMLEPKQFNFIPAKEKETFKSSASKEGVPGLEFDLFTYKPLEDSKAKIHLEVYFHRHGMRQIAVVYQVPADKAAEPAAKDSIRFGLRWLDISDTAGRRRGEYLRYRRPDLPGTGT